MRLSNHFPCRNYEKIFKADLRNEVGGSILCISLTLFIPTWRPEKKFSKKPKYQL